MIRSRPAVFASTLALAVTACATRVSVPEIPILDSAAFKIARPEPEPPVQVVEVPTPLPLPGQLKPLPEVKKAKDARPPKQRVGDANAVARLEPVKDGYINAIQVYPYTKGALYQLHAAVNQVTDIALEPGEKLVSVSAGARCAGWSATPPAMRARTRRCTSWSSRSASISKPTSSSPPTAAPIIWSCAPPKAPTWPRSRGRIRPPI